VAVCAKAKGAAISEIAISVAMTHVFLRKNVAGCLFLLIKGSSIDLGFARRPIQLCRPWRPRLRGSRNHRAPFPGRRNHQYLQGLGFGNGDPRGRPDAIDRRMIATELRNSQHFSHFVAFLQRSNFGSPFGLRGQNKM
jgi:hypothetical protein